MITNQAYIFIIFVSINIGKGDFCFSKIISKRPTAYKRDNHNGQLYRIGAQIPSIDVCFGGGTEGVDGDPEERHRHRPTGPRLPVLRRTRSGKDFVRTYFRQDHQLHQSVGRRRPVQRMRLVPRVQRKPFAQHHRA